MITKVKSLASLLEMAVDAGGGGKVLEDPGAVDGFVVAAVTPPKLYWILRIPPVAGLTARAIPVA